jgi:hypothetical protein
MKVFTRPTSVSDFFFLNFDKLDIQNFGANYQNTHF